MNLNGEWGPCTFFFLALSIPCPYFQKNTYMKNALASWKNIRTLFLISSCLMVKMEKTYSVQLYVTQLLFVNQL